MHFQELIKGLSEAGMGRDEAMLYLHLLRRGPSRAGAAAERTEFSRSKVYRLLDNLVEAGFVTASVDTPTVFTACHPRDLFGALLHRHEARRRQLESLRDTALPHLEDLIVRGTGEARSTWRTKQGRTPAYRLLLELLQEAQSEVLGLVFHPSATNLSPLVETLWEEIARQAREGVEVRFLFKQTMPTVHRMKQFGGTENLEFRSTSLNRDMQFCIIDGSQVLQWVDVDPSERIRSENDVVLHSDAPGLVTPPLNLFESMWPNAQPLP